ncbi:MAG: carboxypeptidase regulatory-like domain-containing protein [Thermoanaerobaculia bacterium]
MHACSLLPAVLTASLLAPATASPAPVEVSGVVVNAPAAVKASLLPLQSNHAWRLAVLAGRPIPDPAATADVGSEGRFVLTAPSAGMWTVVVTAPGRVPMRYLPVPVTDPVELPPVELVPDAGLEVRVLGKDGKPAAGAWVLVTTGSPDLLKTLRADGWQLDARMGRTDAAGRLTLPRVAGEEVKVHAFSPGARRATATVPAGTPKAELVLEPSAGSRTVEVREAGAPAAGVAISAGSPAWPAGVTDREGRLSVPTDGEGPFDLLLADGRRHKLDSLPAVVELPELRRVEGKVLDAATRKPLAWALVWAGDDPGNTTFTGPGGTYAVAERAGGRAWVQVEASGFRPASAKVPQAPGRLPTVALEPARTLAGRVLDKAGAPLAGVAVAVAPEHGAKGEVFRSDRAASRAWSDAEGRFLLRGLAAAPTYQLTASRTGYQPAQATVAPAEVAGEVRLVLERARSAHGMAVDAEGRPLAGVEVTIASSSGGTVTAITGDRGRFEVPALPGDRVDLEARRQGFAPTLVPGVAIAPGPGPADLGTLKLLPGVRIEGRVTGVAGRPLAGAGVWLAAADRQPSPAFAETLRRREPATTTDEAGRFAIADVARGQRVSLLLAREGYVPSWVQGVEAPTARPLTVALERASRLRGRVEDAAGEPVPGASVRLRPAPPPPGTVGVEVRRSENTADVEAGSDGSFAFAEVAPGAVALEASAEGFLPPEPVELQVPSDGEVRLVLGRGAVVAGSITNATGEPVAGAQVRIGGTRSESDAEGRYRLAGIPPGPAPLAVSHPAYKPKGQPVDVQPGENRADVMLERGASVSGRVVDEAGVSRPGAELTLRNRGERGLRGYRASSGAGGRFEILAVADGSFDLEAEADGFAPAVHPAVVEVAGRDVGGLEVVLRRGATLSGRILGLEPGQMAAVEVTAERDGRQPRSGMVDHTGRYEIAALEAGDWHLKARLAGGRREADAWVAIAAGDREAERDLELGGGLALDGLVRFEDRPLPGAQVRLRGLDVTVERSLTADYQGAFRFEDLEPGRYRVEVTHAERMLSQSEDLELAADREIEIEIATATLAGTVVAAGSGEGVAEALVYLQRLLGGDEPGPLTTVGTNAAGSFVTASLAPGRYRLTVRGAGYAPAERIVDAEAGVAAEPLTIELDPTTGLALTVRRAAGEPPVWATVVVLDEGGRPVHVEEPRLSDRGRGFLQQVPPGRWTLLIKAAGSAAALARTTVPGRRLEVTLPRGAALTVRVPALSDSHAAAALTLAAADGTPYSAINPGGSFQQTWPLAGGVVTVPDLPAGSWRLQVTATDGRVWSESLSTNGEAAAAAVIE